MFVRVMFKFNFSPDSLPESTDVTMLAGFEYCIRKLGYFKYKLQIIYEPNSTDFSNFLLSHFSLFTDASLNVPVQCDSTLLDLGIGWFLLHCNARPSC